MTFIEFSAAELTCEHVTAMLRTQPGWTDVRLSTVDVAPVGTGQMANSYRLMLTYSDAPDSAPKPLIVKVSSTDPASRQFAVATSACQREVFFYQRLAEISVIRTPRCYLAEITDDKLGFILLLEDLGPARTVDQLAGCTPDEADLAMTEAAAVHGPSWGHPRLRQEPWLPMVDLWTQLAGSIPSITGIWLDRFGPYLNSEHIPVIEQLGVHVPAWLATVSGLRSLWQGDFRLDNLLFDAQGGRVPLAVVDWQSASAGPGIADVSYFAGNSLVEADRAQHERQLVDAYHGCLVAHGVAGFSADQCWQEYRAHALYGLILTIPVSLGVETTERGDRMFAAMADRAVDQILVYDSYAALNAL